MRKGLGVLLTLGGAALVWLLKDKFLPRKHRRDITLTSKGGRCGVERPPEPVTLRRSKADEVHWIVRNDGSACADDVQVCMGRWALGGSPVDPPVADVNGQDLCRTVPSPQTRPIHGRVKRDAAKGDYYYEVLINGDIAVDPIVRIVDA